MFERRRDESRPHEALALWRGPAFADLAYEPFAQAERARLEELRLVALEVRIDADLALGRHADLVGELEALIAEHPLRERLRGQLMLALYRSGRQAEALQAYRPARRELVERARARAGRGAASGSSGRSWSRIRRSIHRPSAPARARCSSPASLARLDELLRSRRRWRRRGSSRASCGRPRSAPRPPRLPPERASSASARGGVLVAGAGRRRRPTRRARGVRADPDAGRAAGGRRPGRCSSRRRATWRAGRRAARRAGARALRRRPARLGGARARRVGRARDRGAAAADRRASTSRRRTRREPPARRRVADRPAPQRRRGRAAAREPRAARRRRARAAAPACWSSASRTAGARRAWAATRTQLVAAPPAPTVLVRARPRAAGAPALTRFTWSLTGSAP